MAAKQQVVGAVGHVHQIGNGLFGHVGQGVNGGQFHGFVDFRGPNVQRSPENVGETQHVVDLVGVVGAARCHDDVGPGGNGVFVADFGRGVRHRKHNRVVGHRPHHILTHRVAFGQAHKHVGPHEGFFQCAHVAAGGKERFPLVEVGAVRPDNALAVAHHHVGYVGTEGYVELGAGNGRSPRAVDQDFYVLNGLAHDLQRVEQGSRRNDGRAVLVVVHDGDVEVGLEPFLDLEAFRGFDIFQIDPAEGRFQNFDHPDELVHVFGVEFNIEYVDVGVDLKQQALAFHHGFAGFGANIAQAQHGGPVADNGHQIALGGIFINVFLVFGDG